LTWNILCGCIYWIIIFQPSSLPPHWLPAFLALWWPHPSLALSQHLFTSFPLSLFECSLSFTSYLSLSSLPAFLPTTQESFSILSTLPVILSSFLTLPLHACLLSCTLILYLFLNFCLYPYFPCLPPLFLPPFLTTHNCRQTLNDLGSCMASSDIIFLFNWILHCWGNRNEFVLTVNPNCLFEDLKNIWLVIVYALSGRCYNHVAKDTCKFEKLFLVYIHKNYYCQYALISRVQSWDEAKIDLLSLFNSNIFNINSFTVLHFLF